MKRFDLYHQNSPLWEYYCSFSFAESAYSDFNPFDFVKTCSFEISATSSGMCQPQTNGSTYIIKTRPFGNITIPSFLQKALTPIFIRSILSKPVFLRLVLHPQRCVNHRETVRFISSKPAPLGILLYLHFYRKRSPRSQLVRFLSDSVF